MDSTGGSVWPFSQFRTVLEFTPRMHAASFWLSLRWRRQRLRCSPSVRGWESGSFRFRYLSVMGTHGKKATRPCNCRRHGNCNRTGNLLRDLLWEAPTLSAIDATPRYWLRGTRSISLGERE